MVLFMVYFFIEVSMQFETAMTCLKNGQRICRSGWNGQGIFIELQRPDENSKMTLPYLFIDTTALESDNPNSPRGRVPWLASQTDLLSDDWQTLD